MGAVTPTKPGSPTEGFDTEAGAMSQNEGGQEREQQEEEQEDERPPHEEDPEKTSWIEIAMVDESDAPLAGESYEVELPDGSVASGSLDDKGFARIEGIDSGTCKVCFPNLDKDAWEPK